MKAFTLYVVAVAGFFIVIITACGHTNNTRNNRNDTSKTTGNIVKYRGKYICISLSRYINQLYQLISSGQKVPGDVDTLYGMSWIDGYVIDNKNKDIILVGEQKKQWPAYHSDDIFTGYQNVFDSVPPPYCSLDPVPQNIAKLNKALALNTHDFDAKVRNCRAAIGGQKVVIGGVPLNSRIANIMIYADYDMKKISQGLLKVPGIPSILDLSIADSANASSGGASMSRFWLHIKLNENNKTYPNYNENEGIVFINECPVVVLTEKQKIDASGNLKDNLSEKDKNGEAFAAGMSKNYKALASGNVLFAALENMFRLQACLRAMKFKDAGQVSGINLQKMSMLKLAKGNELPASLPGLINYNIRKKRSRNGNEQTIKTDFYIVAGGVSQEMDISKANLYTGNNQLLQKTGKTVLNTRPDSTSIYWNAVVE